MQMGVPPDDWPKIVKMFDIGVAPLFGIYDQFRSWIKGMEYLLAGVPWVGTAGEPYSDIAQAGILIKNSTDAWDNAIEGVINNLSTAKEVARARLPIAQDMLLVDRNLHIYEQVYKQVIQGFNNEHVQLPNVYHVQSVKTGVPA
jgi:glycosyltransferase involved in cell wall biosynthesis